MLDATLLNCFATIVETGGFTRAAEHLGIRQPSISQQMRRLEAEVGRPLLHREGQGIRLTREGEKLLPHAKAVMRAIADAEAHLRDPALSGTVRLGVGMDIAASKLPDVLGFFRRSHGSIRLEIETGLSGALSERLHRGDFDLVLGKRGETVGPGTVIWTDRLCWAISAEHGALVKERPLPLVLPARPTVTREVAHAALSKAKIPFHTVVTSNCASALRAGVLAGLGIGVFGRRFMPPGLEAAQAGDHDLPLLPQMDFGFEKKPGEASPAVEALAAFLRDQDHWNDGNAYHAIGPDYI